MATFEDHIQQAERNLKFLHQVNSKIPESYDWQVTVCFYTALHLINAHLAKHHLQYRQHSEVKNALNFANGFSVAKFPEEEYLAYASLQSLSRRSRYLVNEKDGNLSTERAFLIYEKHLAKAIRHLDSLLWYLSQRYQLNFQQTSLICKEIKNADNLKLITVLQNQI